MHYTDEQQKPGVPPLGNALPANACVTPAPPHFTLCNSRVLGRRHARAVKRRRPLRHAGERGGRRAHPTAHPRTPCCRGGRREGHAWGAEDWWPAHQRVVLCPPSHKQAFTGSDIYKVASAATAGAGASTSATVAFPPSGKMNRVTLIVSDGTSVFLARTDTSTTSGIWESCV